MTSLSPEGSVVVAAPPTTWAPLRIGLFRWLWLGALVSNIGTWMQTVGAQWLLVHEAHAATLVSLVQTAQALPIVLLAFPAGVLADSFDRRLLLIGVQGFQTLAALLLTVLTVANRMTPGLLLSLTFALGAGAAVQAPAYQALVPDLVPRPLIPGASVLGSININLARAIGPAIAGLVVARAGVPAVFALDLTTFIAFGLVLLAWRREPETRGDEPFLPALLAGGRYVRHAPVVRRILLRCAMFVVPANVLWALLAVVAQQRLDLGAGGYGIMLGALGVGSICGAVVLPRVRGRLNPNRVLAAAMLLYAIALVVLIATWTPWLGVLALLPAGMAWIAVLATLNASLQTFLPVWVRARGLAAFQLVLFGSMAAAGAVWGVAAEHFGLTMTYLTAAALLLVGAAAGAALPLHDTAGLDRAPAAFWPDPQVALDVRRHPGTVLVTNTYWVPEENREQLLALGPELRRMRRRTGGTSWSLYVDAADPSRFVEQFTVASWSEHLLQHAGRLTGSDREIDLRARSLSDPPPEVAHLLTAPEDE
jgi:MFS family permease